MPAKNRCSSQLCTEPQTVRTTATGKAGVIYGAPDMKEERDSPAVSAENTSSEGEC